MTLMICPECSAQVSDKAETCPSCGYPLKDKPLQESEVQITTSSVQVIAQKNRGFFIVLGVLFGFLGVHNFYAGFYWQGLFQLLLTIFLWWTVIVPIVVGIWIIADLIMTTHDSSNTRLA